jgi:hypothetical protein
VTQDLQQDFVEMSRHSIYQKYAYLTMREIRDVMFQSHGDDELYFKDDNCMQLDLDDILNLQESPTNGVDDQQQNPREKITSMVILRAPPGSTI